ncbi:DinB family protein [Bacillus massilinigeriensis]|uniref:DinB family protein n=1 Tax=Bacillus massilionigeriensis TaxID=1805475 RepID=UPI00096B4D14|nr:DinB family protein [Bacillus massilionigeriensis]
MNILSFFDYHTWATEKLLNHLDELPKELFSKEIDSVFHSIKETFEHIYTIDRLWLDRLQGNNLTMKKVEFLCIEEAKEEFKYLHSHLKRYLEESDIGDVAVYNNSTGKKFENKIEDCFIHIINHGTYHRGNITAMIRSLGYKSISTDYIFYLRSKDQY